MKWIDDISLIYDFSIFFNDFIFLIYILKKKMYIFCLFYKIFVVDYFSAII